MVAGVITIHNVIDEVGIALRDVDRKLFTDDDDYYQFILPHIQGSSQSYTFTERLTGYFLYSEARTYFLYGATPFSPEDGVTYQLSTRGSIRVSVGTHAGGDIIVTAVKVDFPEIMVDLCQYIATNKAREASVVLGDGSWSVEDTHAKLIEMAQYWRGVRSA